MKETSGTGNSRLCLTLSPGADDLTAAAIRLLQALGPHRIVAFDAPMGAGKTTLIAEMCRILGADIPAASPTFSIVNDYPLPHDGHNTLRLPGTSAIYHFDFYRLDDADAVADIGIFDYLDSGNYCFMEWPRVALPFLPEDTAVVTIEVLPDGSRLLNLFTH